MTAKLSGSSGRLDLCFLQWFPKTTLGNPSSVSYIKNVPNKRDLFQKHTMIVSKRLFNQASIIWPVRVFMLLEINRVVFGQTCCSCCSLLPDGDNVDADKLSPLLSSAAGLQLFGIFLLSLSKEYVFFSKALSLPLGTVLSIL